VLDLLSFKFHRAACEVKYYLKEFYFETEFAFTAIAEKALFTFAAIADKAIFALAAVADEAIFAFTAVTDKAIFAFAAITDKAIFTAGFARYAILDYIAIFAIAAVALGAACVYSAGCV